MKNIIKYYYILKKRVLSFWPDENGEQWADENGNKWEVK